MENAGKFFGNTKLLTLYSAKTISKLISDTSGLEVIKKFHVQLS